MVKQGKIIVLDGLDGCGKSTQFEALGKLLTEQGKTVKSISFPMYDKPSAALVKMYLHGDFSDTPGGVNAYAASSFYAVDRYANYKLDWEKNYAAGEIILASRYTTSNAIHQMSKLPPEQWDDYLRWLEDYEYNKLELPRPDLVLFLSLPLALSQKLLSKRYDGDAAKRTSTRQTSPIWNSAAVPPHMPGQSWAGSLWKFPTANTSTPSSRFGTTYISVYRRLWNAEFPEDHTGRPSLDPGGAETV